MEATILSPASRPETSARTPLQNDETRTRRPPGLAVPIVDGDRSDVGVVVVSNSTPLQLASSHCCSFAVSAVSDVLPQVQYSTSTHQRRWRHR